MNILRSIALILLVVLEVAVSADAKPASCVKRVVCPTSEQNPRNGEGDIVRLKDGRLLLAYSHWTAKAGADDSPCEIDGKYSTDGGLTWGPDFTLIPNDAMNLMSVSLLRLKSGEIMMVYGRRYSNSKAWMYARFSKDEAKTWSKDYLVTPILGYQGMNNARVIQLKGGRLLAPVFFCRGESWEKDYFFWDMVYYSDDNGRTWTTKGQKVTVDGCGYGADEPGLVELKDGRVMMLIRTDLKQIYRCYSSDKGESWSKPEPMGLTAPSCNATCVRIPSTKDLLLIWNNHPTERNPLTCAISQDEGRTWKHIKNLEDTPKGSYSYTSITFVGKTAVLSYYEAGCMLKVAVVDVAWFYE